MVQMKRVRRTKGYESISRDALQVKSLSFKARGIMAYLESMPDDWEVHGAKGIADASDKDGYYAVNEGLKELEAAGLLARLKRQGARARWEWLWIYSDNPADIEAATEEWAATGAVSSRGGNPRPRRQGESITPEAPTSDNSVMEFSVHGGSVSGQAEHGEPPNKEVDLEVDSRGKSFSRDKSLEIFTHARDEDHDGVEARGRPDDDAKVLGVHEQDLFGGDQLPVSNGKIKKPAQRDAEFDAFWRIYPKRVGKIDARRAWDRALTRVELGRLMAGAETYVQYIQGDPWRKQFTKDPATWLNKGCWDDELDFGPPSRNGHQKTIPPRVSATDRAVDEVRNAFRELRESGGQLGLPGGPR
jgi:hypothetical protein